MPKLSKTEQHQVDYFKMVADNSYLNDTSSGRPTRLRNKPDIFDCSVIYEKPQSKSKKPTPVKRVEPKTKNKSKPKAITNTSKKSSKQHKNVQNIKNSEFDMQTPVNELKTTPFDFQDTAQKKKTLERSKNKDKQAEKAKNIKKVTSKQKSRQNIRSRKSSGQGSKKTKSPKPKTPNKFVFTNRPQGVVSKITHKPTLETSTEKSKIGAGTGISTGTSETQTLTPNKAHDPTKDLLKVRDLTIDENEIEPITKEQPLVNIVNKKILTAPKMSTPICQQPKINQAIGKVAQKPMQMTARPNFNLNCQSSVVSKFSRCEVPKQSRQVISGPFHKPGPVLSMTGSSASRFGACSRPNVNTFKVPSFSDQKSTASKFSTCDRPVLQEIKQPPLPQVRQEAFTVPNLPYRGIVNHQNLTKITEEQTLLKTYRDSGINSATAGETLTRPTSVKSFQIPSRPFRDTASILGGISVVNAPSVINYSHNRNYSGNQSNNYSNNSLSNSKINAVFQNEKDVIKITDISNYLHLVNNCPMELTVIDGNGVRIEFINPRVGSEDPIKNKTREVKRGQKYIVSKSKIKSCKDIGVEMMRLTSVYKNNQKSAVTIRVKTFI